MPLPKRQPLPKKVDKAEKATAPANDSRFANFETDPKFRLPSKKHTKTKLDPRFSRLRSDPDFYNKATVDKYGRKISKDAGKKAVDRLYDAESDEDEDEEPEPEPEPERPAGKKRDKAVMKEMQRVEQQGFDPIRDGGLESSSDESSSEEEDDEAHLDDQTELAGEGNDVPTGDISARLAAVNMDWDNIRATDIMAVANSFVPSDGRILNVVIYPSEFGMERLQREEIEGPPREIFASTANKDRNNIGADDRDSDASDTDGGNDPKVDLQGEETGEEFDSTKLRAYQLDRLRYYYAVITCSSANAAKCIYDNLDGQEYLTSANFFDLRFVPDGTTFDQDAHDECTKLPDGYKPNEFSTDALTHSKVKLTWDADDATRKEVQKRAFSRKEIDENELQAYLGEASSSSEDEEELAKMDKAASLRAALGLEAPGKSSKTKKKASAKKDRDFPKPDSEMQITFTGGLSNEAGNGQVFENDIPLQETTMEKYIRKEKERKAKRKERWEAKKAGRDPDAPAEQEDAEPAEANDDDPFNDPFFASDPEEAAKATKTESKKSKKAKKKAEQELQDQATAAERANLELLMADDDDSKVRHFDMNEILKSEKAKKKKGKKAKKNAPIVEDGFKLDTTDPRFAKLYESHEFAIDPTNPRFKETEGMKALLEEGRKKRKQGKDGDEPEAERETKKSKQDAADGEDDIKKLAARVVAPSCIALASWHITRTTHLCKISPTNLSTLDQAFDTKGNFTPHAPVTYIRERFLENEWRKHYAWRPFLDPLIIGFGDQQLITGYAVLLSGWVKYKLIAKICLTLVVVFAVFLLTSMIVAIALPPAIIVNQQGTTLSIGRVQRLSFLVPLFLILTGFSTALVCILYDPEGHGIESPPSSSGSSLQALVRRLTDSKLEKQTYLVRSLCPARLSLLLVFYLFLNLVIAFIVQILLAILPATLVLTQKFAAPADPIRICGLQDDDENVWGFGQPLSVVILLLPTIAALQTYLEARQDIKQGFTRPSD
ncbi:pre-rrna-processing protein esf1 [Stemphylium lycopersici]|uniref:Pre-rrna-processing protein esf1 n=1 Tax=Stemphylium lycopersici TaxID=183478 RepID=A0A364N9F2_STELY|nr:pre-rrna-processing protein esf1 [Stemphylium lycopersici]